MTTDKRKETQNHNDDSITGTMGKTDAPHERTSLGIDAAYYQSFLDDLEISKNQKRELIETLWQIVTGFIELGFSVHPLNDVQNKIENTETALALKTVIKDFADDEPNTD